MSIFTDKMRSGQLPTEAEWEEHLLEAHAQEPRMTPEAFAGFKTEDGHNSYEVLARLLPTPAQDLEIVDLACGDGHLIPYLLPRLGPRSRLVGVDISKDGLEIAAAQVRDPRVSWVLARAQNLPFADHSVDHIFCHMAFMLMSPLEPVVAEIARVLKPGGRFSAVLPGSNLSSGPQLPADAVYREIQRLSSIFVATHLPRFAEARKGSPIVGTEEGLNTLFGSSFKPVEGFFHFKLRYHVPPMGVWDLIRNKYFTPMMPAHVQREFKDDLLALARDHLDGEGKVLFHFPMKWFSVVRRS